MKPWLDQDLNIFYLPGSGGFFLLFMILLEHKHFIRFKLPTNKDLVDDFFKFNSSKKYFYRLTKDQYTFFKGKDWPLYEDYYNDVSSLPQSIKDDIFKHILPNDSLDHIPGWKKFEISHYAKTQFAVNVIDNWKAKENWPDNELTKTSNLPNEYKHKIYFHCNDYNNWLNSSGYKVALYTDLQTQVRMCWHKKAGLFAEGLNNRNYTGIRSMYKLAGNFNDTVVNRRTIDALNIADKIIYLQDLVNDPFVSTGLSGTIEQSALYKLWVDANIKFKLLRK